GIVRTIHWHERTVAAAASRYGAPVFARTPPPGLSAGTIDRPVADGDVLPGDMIGHWLTNGDELALWLPIQQALVFGDAMLRGDDGTLRRCPDSWLDLGHRSP